MRVRRAAAPRPAVALLVALVVTAGCGGTGAARRATASVRGDIGAGLQGPSGLGATVYAKGLPKVAAFAFDSEGRLWAATADYSDSGHDGLYLVAAAGAPPVEVVADLHTPLGLLWDQGSLYVSSSGRVDAFGGFDGAHFQARRTVLTLPADVGEVNTLARAPSGRLVLGISAPCDHCVPPLPWSAAIVSFLPDGSDLKVEVSGIRAPVGLAYDPQTGQLLVTMNQRDDLGSQTPGDFLSSVESGQAWHFPNCFGQGGAACAGVPAPIAVLDPHAAVSDVAVIGRAAVVAEWAVGKVLRVSLPGGSVSTLLTGVKNPVAVAAGPDGGLYVGDWGTGTVYRVTGANTVA